MISDLKHGAFFFFGAILMGMGIWAFFCVPETKGIANNYSMWKLLANLHPRHHTRRDGRSFCELVL
jgi:hypothetical protein